ncbi:DUF2589 domain-containing protein [Burkholderia stagnalis]|uniref:DUF2589 domain-containing protein n=1 Tax=Burkholderia stagnalis TaxID=1503054 RepID=UPI00075E8963|nr:DUF2589 domain-containing protein [Burkholderia stagnalis]KVN11533.1 hypothetical protein WT09_22570 [Burkholderia stagnalis]KVN38871.1 hypothetical protein WT11_03880 [Burkholderia stagnalis]KWI43124.1 hypothetical protein WT71_28000 [Burkholderia stagnalis]KWI80180.1 hypothetical protein WT73_04005 [Burkholderia stagnalis]KWK10408.1 hypothetical protein WT76_10025 [Burkholderia stagnalis]
MDANFIGSVINALPMDQMIAGPLNAMINAQTQAAKSYTDFLMQVCIQGGKAVAVQFDYDETLVDESGVSKGVVQKTMRIPLLAAVVHPIIAIEEGTIDFEMEITQSEKASSSTEGSGEFKAKIGWGPVSVSLSGRVSHKSEQTRSTDTRAKYSIHTQIKRQQPPEALMRVIDFLTDAATKPAVTADKAKEVKPLPATPTDGTLVGETSGSGAGAAGAAGGTPAQAGTHS